MGSLRRLFGYTLPYKRFIIISVVGALGVAASDSLIAFSVGKVLKKELRVWYRDKETKQP